MEKMDAHTLAEMRRLPASKAAKASLKRNADPKVLAAAKKAVDAKTHWWIWDPEVRDVLGLVKRGTNEAAIVVYLAQDDFELDGDFEMSL